MESESSGCECSRFILYGCVYDVAQLNADEIRGTEF